MLRGARSSQVLVTARFARNFFSRLSHALRADVAGNDLADECLLELITERARQQGAPMNLNQQRRALTSWWKNAYRAIRLIEWSGLSKSDLVLSLAIDEGSTPLHVAARKGSLRKVQWILDHGGAASLHARTTNGHTPLSVAHAFGPHPEVEAVLEAAMRASPAPPPRREGRSSGWGRRVLKSRILPEPAIRKSGA